MKQYILILLFAIAAFSGRAQPPNNLIFFGGAGDGNSQAGFAISGNLIFAGSTGDGAGQASNNSSSNSLFYGGVGDGMSSETNGTVSNVIFLGNEGDGFANSSNNAIPNSIFLGSDGDGFSNSTNAALSNNIFRGGEGDGWNAVILLMGPLPVELLSFTAEHSDGAHLVKWVTTAEINTHHFEVQVSVNGRDFTGLGNQLPAGNPSMGASYNFKVMEPLPGNNFYRLKIIDTDGSVTYSNVVLLKNMGKLQLSVFPNPTADALQVRLPLITDLPSVNAAVYDAQGKLVLQQVLKTGITNILPVQQLPAGMYTLHCVISQQAFTCRFIKK